MPPFFSILVPTYNDAEFLPAALDSILAQTDPDWEAIVVNDGSTDNTASILADYSRRDSRIRVFHQSNGGTAAAINTATEHATGEWVCWLHSDDFFSPTKLAVHRAGIVGNPMGSFFVTGTDFMDENGKITEERLSRPFPEPKWQVLEMMRCNFINTLGICVYRDIWKEVGPLNPRCGYAQDYDQFLRILRLTSAIRLPERTATTRENADRATKTFFEALLYGSARAGIVCLNKTRFENLFPFLDLNDAKGARDAINKAMDVASSPHSFIYALGPHLGLLMSAMEWLWSERSGEVGKGLRRLFTQRAWVSARSHRGTTMGFLFRAAAVASELPVPRFEHGFVDVVNVAEHEYRRLCVANQAKAALVRRYLKQFENVDTADVATVGVRSEETLVACQIGDVVAAKRPYGGTRMTLERAKSLSKAGRDVLLLGLSDQGLGYVEGVPFIGTRNNVDLIRAAAAMGPVDTVIGVGRADVFRWVRARKYVVYQHGDFVPQGATVRQLNTSRVSVICVSTGLRNRLAGFGIRPELMSVVHNGYDHSCFHHGAGNPDRLPRSIAFVGAVTDYKGTDIAILAFRLLRERYPDATMTICGVSICWKDAVHLFPDGWLTAGGYPDWRVIETAVPGLVYKGDVAPIGLAEVYRSHSLLVMPSRVHETFGIVSLEAQACGCLPVLPRKGGFPETMMEGATGYLYDDETPKGLANAIGSLWDKGLPTEHQRSKAREWVRQTFSWERSGQEFLEQLTRCQPYRLRSIWAFGVECWTYIIRMWLRSRLCLVMKVGGSC